MAQGSETAAERPLADSAALRGSNQSGMRAHNERLVLSLVRRDGALAKSDIARITGLSAQTVSVIMRSLEADGLLLRGEPVRGRIGQPSVPMSLAADGAFFFGLKIGRRSVDLVLVNLLGEPVGIPPADLSLSDTRGRRALRRGRAARAALGPALRPARTHRRHGDRDAVPAVELDPVHRRATGGAGRLARPRHRGRAVGAVRHAGDRAERRDGGLRGGTGLRHGRAAAGFPLLLPRLLHRRRPRAERATFHGQDGERGGRGPNAGDGTGRARAAADDGGLAVHPGRHAVRGGGKVRLHLGKPRSLGDERGGAGALDRDGGGRAGKRHAERGHTGGDRHGDDRRLDARDLCGRGWSRRRAPPSTGRTCRASRPP